VETLQAIAEPHEDDVVDETTDEVIPFRYSITSYGADYTVDSLVKRLEQEVILTPKFQRSYVWSITRASRFIESLLLGLPVPGIFLPREVDTAKMLIIDGEQRLRTLQFFYAGIFQGREFKLVDVQAQFEGSTYKTLEEGDRLRLDDSIIHATVVKQDEPSGDQSSIYQIFERLNTGGMQLQPQEIRACIFHGPFNELLHELNEYPSWRKIYGAPSARLKDQELLLRYFALYFWLDKYERPMKEFLNAYMGANRNFKLQSSKILRSKFRTVIDEIRNSIGEKAFRPERALNAAVFDAVMVGLSKRLNQGGIENKQDLVKRYSELTNNEKFLEVCKAGSSDAANVTKRIQLATEAFESLK
jgi:Protein of unknown function DUF262